MCRYQKIDCFKLPHGWQNSQLQAWTSRSLSSQPKILNESDDWDTKPRFTCQETGHSIHKAEIHAPPMAAWKLMRLRVAAILDLPG